MSVYRTEIKLDTERALASLREMPGLFVPTGSRVYGGATESSDYDFVVNENLIWLNGEIMRGLIAGWRKGVYIPEVTRTLVAATPLDYVPSEDAEVEIDPEKAEHDVVYLVGWEVYDPRINLIFVNHDEHKAWAEATRILEGLKGADRQRLETSKEARVLAFRVLRRALRAK